MKIYFTSREHQRKINEIMADLLINLKRHCDEETSFAIQTTLDILQNTEVLETAGEA